MAAGFRGLLELLGLWPSAPSTPDLPGCADVFVLPVGSAVAADLLAATAAVFVLPTGSADFTLERC